MDEEKKMNPEAEATDVRAEETRADAGVEEENASVKDSADADNNTEKEFPEGEMPVNETPGDKMSADKEPVNETPENKMSADKTEPGTETGSDEASPIVEDIVIEDIAPEKEPDQGTYYDEKAFQKYGKKKKAFKIALLCLVLLLLTGYGVMTALSYKYFQANTVINGVNYSFQTPDVAQAEIDEKIAGYHIRLMLRDGSLTISPSDIGLVITSENDIQSIKDEQNPFLWFMGFFRDEQKAAYKISFDRKLLEDYIRRQASFRPEKMIAPTNPTIEMKDGSPVIIPGVKGNTVDVDKVIRLVSDMIPKMETELNIDEAGCYLKAEYEADSERVMNCRDKIAGYTNLMLIYQIGEINIQIKSDEIYQMLNVDLSDYYCVVSRLKVQDFVEKFADTHDTFGTERLFRTHDGKMVKLTSDKIGWQVDREAELQQLYQDICRKNSFIREPVFSERAFSYNAEGSDIGNTYVEVDLTNQKAYYYRDKKLIKSCDVISGRPSRGADTPGGFYTINSIWKNVVLRGPGYASPVDYWMPFNGGIGLHDASWQSRFGGDLFITRGSHGCVNLEYDMAKLLYENAYKGMSVVCYWRNSRYMVNPQDAIDNRVQQFFGL